MLVVTRAIFSVALLAGGRSRRLGGVDKGALVVGGRTIQARQVEAARTTASHVFMVAARDMAAPLTDLTVIPDRTPGAGALGALVTALEASPTDVVVVVAGDMPFVNGAFLAWLADGLCGRDALVPRDAGGLHPLCAAYDRRCAGILAAAIDAGLRRVQDAVATIAAATVGPEDYAAFDPDGRLLFNVNTPEDYHAALKTNP